LIAGRHTIKFGFFHSSDRWDGYGRHRPNGSFGFSQQATSVPLDNSQNPGNAFLLGYATSWGLETPRLVRQIYKYYGGYLQDDWKVSTKLTLNLGLRYEYTLQPTLSSLPSASAGKVLSMSLQA
jgi:outer membrane receptor protein involved in Fe transport